MIIPPLLLGGYSASAAGWLFRLCCRVIIPPLLSDDHSASSAGWLFLLCCQVIIPPLLPADYSTSAAGHEGFDRDLMRKAVFLSLTQLYV